MNRQVFAALYEGYPLASPRPRPPIQACGEPYHRKIGGEACKSYRPREKPGPWGCFRAKVLSPQRASRYRTAIVTNVRPFVKSPGVTVRNADSLAVLNRLKENKALLRIYIPVARRVLGETYDLTLRMRCNYAIELCRDTGATLDDLREGVTTLEDVERIGRRVFGGAHPDTIRTETSLRKARAVLRARETQSPGSS